MQKVIFYQFSKIGFFKKILLFYHLIILLPNYINRLAKMLLMFSKKKYIYWIDFGFSNK